MPPKKIKKVKGVKAWFVDIGFKGNIRWFSGKGYGYKARIYRTLKQAKAEWGYYDVIYVPVLVTIIKKQKR